MLELINRGRANPAAEAAKFGVALNEGVTGTPITTAAKQPLTMNPYLTSAIRDHVNWLRLNDKFQHTGSGGTQPAQRIVASGYALSGSYGTAENLGLTLGSTLGDLPQRMETIYRNLFVDEDVAGRGHRVNLLNDAMKEAGVGVATGDYTYNNNDWTAILAGQDFAYRPGSAFLTGVIYTDTLNPNDFYSPGEGLHGFTVTATAASGAQYTSTTGFAGGYSIQLPPGTYTVTAVGSSISGVAKYVGVVVGDENVKRDFERVQFAAGETAPSPIAGITDGTLAVSGTNKSESISVLLDGSSIEVQMGSIKVTFPSVAVQRVSINAGKGHDFVLVGETIPATSIVGGDGNDTLVGTASEDTIEGGAGNDQISAGGSDDIVNGGDGNDTVIGEGGRDTIHGEDGIDRLNGSGGNDQVHGDGENDRVYGGGGHDFVDGGGNVDRVYGEDGDDSIIGGSSNDRLYGGDGDDLLWGGKGKDHFDGGAGTNVARDRDNIESVLNAT